MDVFELSFGVTKNQRNMDEWYSRIPIVTRTYLTLIGLTTLGCQLKLFSRFQLFFNWKLFWNEGQVSSFQLLLQEIAKKIAEESPLMIYCRFILLTFADSPC
jgi:hypothetical protein